MLIEVTDHGRVLRLLSGAAVTWQTLNQGHGEGIKTNHSIRTAEIANRVENRSKS